MTLDLNEPAELLNLDFETTMTNLWEPASMSENPIGCSTNTSSLCCISARHHSGC
ncbi:hypothetical protein [Streptomyces sp. H39-S7]|uniref:hypothetical protein n=1 Tax=Streptomyces sp. H39-S7 TaxID=3004357 RepID=UPI0022AFCB76|nr:hypothetical protein [Streptomyces sp. H39-S7]MCZ4120034.1 hypothetical protein [Streptomyces sp. H39-S7]